MLHGTNCHKSTRHNCARIIEKNYNNSIDSPIIRSLDLFSLFGKKFQKFNYTSPTLDVLQQDL